MIERPYWWDTLAPPSAALGSEDRNFTSAGIAQGSPLDARVDVAIVGAGYTGLAAARQLARTGASVIVFERERAGWGASSRNGGQVVTGLKLSPAALVARFGEARARVLFESSLASIAALERLIADEGIACDYEQTGHLQAAWKPAHFRGFQQEQALLARVFNQRVELVSRRDQRSELGSDLYHGLLVDERSAALNPAKYAAGLAAAAKRAGAVLVEGIAVLRLSPAGSRWSVTTSAGAIDAGLVLVATNGYADSATPLLQHRVVPVGSYIVATEPLAPDLGVALLPRRRVAFDSKNFLYYWRVTQDHRLLFGGRAEFSRPTPDTTARAASILRTGMLRVFPQLSKTALEYAWGGNIAMTRDQMPHAGRLDGAFYAGGYCGHGIAMATQFGTLIARRMAGESIDHPLFDDRFPAIPLYTGNPWFLPIVGAYYELKDMFL